MSLLLPLAVVVAFLMLVAGTAAAVLRWWAYDEAGSAWLVARLPAVEVKGFQGALLGERWQADRVRVTWAGGSACRCTIPMTAGRSLKHQIVASLFMIREYNNPAATIVVPSPTHAQRLRTGDLAIPDLSPRLP
ncbi:MAG: hypothetical protein WCK33_11790 [Phycisphaerae bacterium]